MSTSHFPTMVPEAAREYAERGFVVTEDVLTPAEITRFGDAVDAEVADRTHADTRALADKSTYEQSFQQCMRLWETSDVVRLLSCHPTLAGIAAQLLGADSVLLWQDQALYKEPGGRITDPHQDQPFWPIGEAPLVSAWIPFDDISSANGAMAYVPGSHLAGGLKPVDITHRTKPYDILSDPALGGAQPVEVPVRAGSVIWHGGFTVHGATANTTTRPRRVFTIVYLAKGYRRQKGWQAYPLDRAGVGAGELMEGVGMPQVWPPITEPPVVPTQRGQMTGPQYG